MHNNTKLLAAKQLQTGKMNQVSRAVRQGWLGYAFHDCMYKWQRANGSELYVRNRPRVKKAPTGIVNIGDTLGHVERCRKLVEVLGELRAE